MDQLGLVHAYTGDGKGKTTASVGLCVRAAGRGLRVLFCQFLKGRSSGELASLEKLGVTIMRMQDPEAQVKFTFQMTEEELNESRRQHAELLARAKAAAQAGEYDLVVLDESIVTVSIGLLEESALCDLIAHKSSGTELVMTGRGLPPALAERCDYISEIVMRKHPYEKGVQARRGIEY